MARTRIRKHDFQKVGQNFHWALSTHYRIWFNGHDGKDKRVQNLLSVLSSEGKLIARRRGKCKIYSVPRMRKGELKFDYGYEIPEKYRVWLEDHYLKVDHGLGCTEAIVRFHRSDLEAEIIPERYFQGTSSRSDFGIMFENSLLAVEYSTRDNFFRYHNIKGKMSRYVNNLPKIKDKFTKGRVIVLFILDVPREVVEQFVKKNQPADEFMFVSYKDFLSVPYGQQLTSSIYLWRDGKTYPLKNGASI